MIIAVCDPKGIAIEAIKTILYHDKGLSDRISRIYEFWNMEQLLDASRDSSFDCIVFPNYCNSHNSVVCSLSCGYNRFPLVEHDPRYTLIVRDILYWETARSLWTQYLKAIPGKEEKVKRAIRGILADYEKEERDHHLFGKQKPLCPCPFGWHTPNAGRLSVVLCYIGRSGT